MNRLVSILKSRSESTAAAARSVAVNGQEVAPLRVAGLSVRRDRRATYVVTRAESAPCTCPEFCERDHETD